MEAEQTDAASGALAEQAGLGSTTKSASTDAEGRVVRRFALQNVARRLLPEHRVSACMRVLKPGAAGVDVLYDPEHEAAHYGGLMTCGSAWVCPVCNARITERRRAELQGALDAHPELTPILVTPTLQHRLGDSLAGLLKALKGGMRFARSGRGWGEVKQRFGIIGAVTGTEPTYSDRAGWHPHEHIMLLSTLPASEIDAAELKGFLNERYGGFLLREGYYTSDDYGVDVVIGNAAVASYVSKVGWGVAAELTKANSKQARSDGGVSPWGLLARAGEGDERAGELFQEYAEAFHGKRLLVYTKGLRALLGLVDDVTDETLAEQEQEAAVILATLTRHQWRVVLAKDKRGELLGVASAGDPEALWRWLAERLGISGEPEPDVGEPEPDVGEPVKQVTATCELCGAVTDDWWMYNGATGKCKCRACLDVSAVAA